MNFLSRRRPCFVAASRGCMIFAAMLFMALVTNRLNADDYVLLNNGNVIQGKATSIGSHVVIDRGNGNELRLPANQVVHSATTLLELYRHRQQKNKLPTVDSYQDNARWCFRFQLYDEMKLALDAAESLDPTHPETLRLQRQLASVTSHANDILQFGTQPTPSPGHAIISVAPELPNRPKATEASEADLAKANLSFQAIAYFSNRVQPLLINRCGNTGCHRGPSDTSWHLIHMGAHVRPPSRMTKVNLLSTLAIINRENGQDSDLLKFATTPHGGRDEAPLKRGDDASIESLNEWIVEVSQYEESEAIVSLTQLPELSGQAKPVVVGQPSSREILPIGDPVRQVAFMDGEAPLDFDEIAGGSVGQSKDLPSSTSNYNRPTRLPTVENPFDPEIFNRYYRTDAVANKRDK